MVFVETFLMGLVPAVVGPSQVGSKVFATGMVARVLGILAPLPDFTAPRMPMTAKNSMTLARIRESRVSRIHMGTRASTTLVSHIL